MQRTRAALSGRWCRAPPPRWAAPQLPQHDAAQRLVKPATKLLVCPVRRDFPASPGQTLLEKMQWSMWRRKAHIDRLDVPAAERGGEGAVSLRGRLAIRPGGAAGGGSGHRGGRQQAAAARRLCGGHPAGGAGGRCRGASAPAPSLPYRKSHFMCRRIVQALHLSPIVRRCCVGYVSACVIPRGSKRANDTGIADSGRCVCAGEGCVTTTGPALTRGGGGVQRRRGRVRRRGSCTRPLAGPRLALSSSGRRALCALRRPPHPFRRDPLVAPPPYRPYPAALQPCSTSGWKGGGGSRGPRRSHLAGADFGSRGWRVGWGSCHSQESQMTDDWPAAIASLANGRSPRSELSRILAA